MSWLGEVGGRYCVVSGSLGLSGPQQTKEETTMVVLYPIVASMIIVVAQYAFTRGGIAKLRGNDEEHKLWNGYRNFCYLFAGVLILASFIGVFWYRIPGGF